MHTNGLVEEIVDSPLGSGLPVGEYKRQGRDGEHEACERLVIQVFLLVEPRVDRFWIGDGEQRMDIIKVVLD